MSSDNIRMNAKCKLKARHVTSGGVILMKRWNVKRKP